MRPVRRTLCLLALMATAAAVVAGCSDDDAGDGAAATAAGPAALRVVQGGELAGFTATPVRALDLKAIAAENEVNTAELRRRGVVRAAKAELSGPPRAFGVSVAEELATPAQARAEAARLLAANGTSEPGLTATPIAVPGVPDAKGVRKAGRRNGQDFVAFEIVWTEGVVTHELFVLGRAGDVRQADVVAAAAAVSAGGGG